MKQFIYVWLLLWIPLFVVGQVEYKEEKTKINSIKRNAGYVYGEGIGETVEEALNQAEEELEKEITILISENKTLKDADKIMVQMIKKSTSKIELKRGSSFRIFLYAEKDRIQNADHSLVMDNPVRIISEQSKGRNGEDPESKQPPVEEATIVEEIPETVLEEPLAEEGNESGSPVEIASPLLSRIVSCKDAGFLQTLFAQLKEEHKLMWGKVQTDIKPSWYIVVTEGDRVLAVLDKGLNNRLNLLTGEKVTLGSFSNYPKCWFIIYE